MNELTKIPFGDPSRVGLILPPGLGELEWKSEGHSLLRCKDSLQFWIGDWINYGQAEYGHKYTEAMKVLSGEGFENYGFELESLHNIASVCKRVPISLRNEKLSWSHHVVAADVKEEDRGYWLEVAAKEGLTVLQMRQRARNSLANPATKIKNPLAGLFTWEKWFGDWTRGWDKFQKRMPLEKWEPEDLTKRITTIRQIEQPLIQEANRRGLKIG